MEGMPVTSQAGPGPDHDGPWLVPLLVLVAGMFMSLLDTTIINVAVPRMQQDFGVSTTDIQWVITAYTLMLGVIVPLSGWLGDRFGPSRVYLWSMVAFAATSALCGVAWDLNTMIAFRIIQAVPGGILPVIAMSMVYRLVPKENLGIAMGIYGIGVSFAPALGPTLGGYLVEYVDWRLIFFINAPLGAAGAVAAVFLLPKIAPGARKPFDWWGFATIALGLFALLLAFSKAEDWHWNSYRIMLLLTFSVLCLGLFVVIELERDSPLIELRILRSWPFVNSLLLVTILMVGLLTILFFLPLFMQVGQGLQAFPTGLTLLPESLIMAFLMPVAGQLYDKIGPRWPIAVGLAIAALGTYLLCGITADMTRGDVVLWTCVRAVGNGLALMPIMTAGLASVPAEHTSSGTTLSNLAQRIAGSLGIAVMTVISDNTQSQSLADRAALTQATSTLPEVRHALAQGGSAMYGLYQQLLLHATADSYRNVFFTSACVSVLGFGLGLLLRKPTVDESAPAAPNPAPIEVAPERAPVGASR